MPSDWADLLWDIAAQANLRMVEPEAPPYMFGRFEALDTIVGGMGMIIVGRDPQLDRKVAIKLWKTAGPAAEAAAIREAQLLARLSHPNVVTIYEAGKRDADLYFVMEFVAGIDGQRWLRGERSWRQTRDVFVDAARGLAAAHDAGIQHRDFKPANMLVGADGRARVADFGVAAALGSTAAEPSEPPAGTTSYMAPERLRGGPGDARSDQFSFCVALWKGLFGARPFAGRTAAELLAAIEAGRVRGDAPEVPSWLREAVRKGLAASPERRYRDMHELIEALTDDPPGGEARIGGPAGGGPLNPGGHYLHSPANNWADNLRFFAYGSLVTGALALIWSLAAH